MQNTDSKQHNVYAFVSHFPFQAQQPLSILSVNQEILDVYSQVFHKIISFQAYPQAKVEVYDYRTH
jgi:hypothetical protein